MSETNYSVGQDLKEARAMVDGLDRYIRGNDIYGRVGSGGIFSMSQMPSLTLGALLMRLRRLRALRDTLNPQQQAELEQLIAANEKTRNEWREHYHSKLEREAISRLKAMSTFFEEIRDNPKLAATSYQPEALRRTIAQVLRDTMQAEGMPVDKVDGEMGAVDSRLRRWFNKGKFIWAAALEPAYPEQPYWWLYVEPKPSSK